MSDIQPTEADFEYRLLSEYAERMTQIYFGGNDGVCSPMEENKAIELLRSFRSDAVKAERDRLEPYCIHTKSCALVINHPMVGRCTCGLDAILSDDQEASNG